MIDIDVEEVQEEFDEIKDSVLEKMAKSSDTSPEDFVKLASYGLRDFLYSDLIDNPALPPEAMNYILTELGDTDLGSPNCGDYAILISLASHLNVTPEILDELSEYGCQGVKKEVAINSRTSTETLHKLIQYAQDEMKDCGITSDEEDATDSFMPLSILEGATANLASKEEKPCKSSNENPNQLRLFE